MYGSSTHEVLVVLGNNLPTSAFGTIEKLMGGTSTINTTPLSGLGDKALSFTLTSSGGTQTGVIARQGSKQVGVEASGVGHASPGVSVKVATLESLVRHFLG